MNRKQFTQAVHFRGEDFRVMLPTPKRQQNFGVADSKESAPQTETSRRSFFRMAAGASTIVFAPIFVSPSAAQNLLPGALPRPITGGIMPLGPGTPVFHFNLPNATSELSTITDFNGKIGVANLGGTGTGTNTNTGETSKLVYDVDVRFMQGEYIGTDGKDRFGTFGFIWLDVYTGPAAPDFSNQVHDYNPGIASNGLFWTVPIPDSSVDTNLFDGAFMRLTDFSLMDFTSVPKSLMGGSSVRATVSVDIRWRTERLIIDQQKRFSGRFFGNSATIQWSSKQDGFQFVSDPLETPTNEFSLIGDERNGVFFP